MGSQAHVILQRAAIKPHLTEYWIMSDFSQPEFEERCSAVCGLYVDPPENVLVVSIDVGDVLAMASKTRNRFDLIRFLDHLRREHVPIAVELRRRP